jgi:hypothetical protein
MCNRLFLLALLVSLLIGVSSFGEPVGVFEDNMDVGDDPGIGSTLYEGYVWRDDVLSEQYLITASGHDVWDNSDDFHYSYNTVSGNIRVSASFEWVVKSNDWAKYGVMLRNTTDGGSVHRFMCDRGLNDYAAEQGRNTAGGGSSAFGSEWNATNAKALGIQRVTDQGLTFIEGLVDKGDGNGWQSTSLEMFVGGSPLNDELLAGVAVTSHDSSHLSQARCWNVQYEANPGLVGEFSIAAVPADTSLGECPSDTPGFSIRSLKPLVTDGWGVDAMNELLDTGMYMGLPAMPGSEGTRVDEFVNLYDTGGRGSFSEANGYPDVTYPGIDPFESPAADPAAGDDDDQFATEVLGYIQLTAGRHIIGANHDDDVYIYIGGVLVGSKNTWDGGSPSNFVFDVEADGCYDLQVRSLEGGGGAQLELQEVLSDGTRILLNDVADGGSPVFAPAE